MVGVLHEAQRSDELHERTQRPGHSRPTRGDPASTACGTDPDLRLDRPHVPAAPAQRGRGATTSSPAPSPTARTTRDVVRAGAPEREDPGIWNPLPYFDTVKNDGQLGNIQSVDKFYAAAKAGTLPAVSWVVPSGAVSEHPPARSARAGVRHEPRQRGHAEPRLGLDRDLPGVGRLGRLLRPRRAARPSTRTATGCACPASSSAPTRSRATSTTRR